MGVDIPNTENLVASNKNVEEIRSLIGADSLAYLSYEGMISSVKKGRTVLQEEKGESDGYCGACFTGKYPLKVDDW